MAHVAVPSDTSLTAGDVIPVAATIDMSGHHMWVGYVNTEIVAVDSTVNENVSYSCHLYLLL